MYKPTKPLLLLVMAISGVTSGLSLLFLPFFANFAPGLIFGIASALVLVPSKQLRIIQATAWIIASIVSWNIAFLLYRLPEPPSILSMCGAGAIGAALLAISYRIITKNISPTRIALTSIVGIVGALAMFATLSGSGLITGDGNGAYSTIQISLSFMIWQVFVSAVLFPQPKLDI